MGLLEHSDAHSLDEFKPPVSTFRQFSGAKGTGIAVRMAKNSKLGDTRSVDQQGSETMAFCSSKRENLGLLQELEKLGVTCVLVSLGSTPVAASELFESREAVLDDPKLFAEQLL